MSIRHSREISDGSAAREPQGRSLPVPPLALVLGGVVTAVVLAAVLWPRGESANISQPTAPAVAVLPTAPPTAIPATATPSCPSIASYVRVITAHEQAARWDKALTEAENALAVSDLCDADRKVLTRYAVSDGLKDLYTQPFKPLDKAEQQQMVDRYLALKQRAHDANVPIDTPLQVAATSFTSSQFHLARVALEEAIKDRSFIPATDRDITKMYASTLFGLGKWYTTAEPDSAIYQEGLGWLAAADKVQMKYQLGDGAADALLSQLGFSDRAKRPAPASTPLLP